MRMQGYEKNGLMGGCMQCGGDVDVYRYVPAALLAEALLLAGGGDGAGLGVVLADLVAAVVVLGAGEVGLAAFGLAPRRLVVKRVHPPGPGEEPVDGERIP